MTNKSIFTWKSIDGSTLPVTSSLEPWSHCQIFPDVFVPPCSEIKEEQSGRTTACIIGVAVHAIRIERSAAAAAFEASFVLLTQIWLAFTWENVRCKQPPRPSLPHLNDVLNADYWSELGSVERRTGVSYEYSSTIVCCVIHTSHIGDIIDRHWLKQWRRYFLPLLLFACLNIDCRLIKSSLVLLAVMSMTGLWSFNCGLIIPVCGH